MVATRTCARTVLLACALGVLAPVALAQGLDPTLSERTVLRVTGVAARDVLNVRRAPSGNAQIVGWLSPLADFVILLERRGAWVRIEYERNVSVPVRGWVAARYLERTDSEYSPTDGAWLCAGSDPFWNVWIEDGQVRYRTDLGTSIAPLADLIPSRNEPGTTWTFTFGEGERRIVALMHDGQVCSDGMSDVTTRRALLLNGPEGIMRTGCCSRPPADARPPEPGLQR